MLEVAPKPGRNPLGDAGFDPAFRVDQRVGADPLDRRRGRQDGSRVTAGLDEPAHQVLVRLRPWRFFAEPGPRAHAPRRPRRTGIRTGGAVIHDGRRNELARSQQAARVAEHAQLQREAQLVAGTPPGPDVLQVFVAQGVVAQQVGLALRKGKQGPPAAGLSERFSEPFSFSRRMRGIESDMV